MKKGLIGGILFFLVAFYPAAQIPNNGFENWTDYNPDGWTTCNNSSTSTNPVTKSTDHYPDNVGSYSIRMENYVAGATGCKVFGFVNDALALGSFGPSFPITGHPTHFYGYYKCFPQNNDTISIGVALYMAGALVSIGNFNTTATVSNWTLFDITLSPYSTADSAGIGFSAFYTVYGKLPKPPRGNSILMIDNISFDTSITSLSKTNFSTDPYKIYLNKGSNELFISLPEDVEEATFSIFDALGRLIISNDIFTNRLTLNIPSLANGLYVISLNSKTLNINQKLFVQH